MQAGSEQLRDWMDRRGFNQTETANYLGFDIPFVSQLVNGRRNPGLTNAVAIERKTGIPVEAWATELSQSEDDGAGTPSVTRLAKAK